MATPNHPSIDLLYGAPSIGLVIASFMSGVVTLQAFLYYRTYNKDSASLKALVAFIWVLDIVHLIVITHFVYYHTITHWGDVSVFNKLTWSWGLQLLLNTLIMFACQIFLTYRFKVISNGNWWITSVLAFFALVQLVFGVYSAAIGFTQELAPTVEANLRSKVIGSTWLISGALDDALIALSLTYYLRARSSVKSALVDQLILYTSGTGALTSIIAIANIATYLAMQNNLVHLALNFPLGRIYTNSLFSSLNMRQALRDSDRVPTSSRFSFNFRTDTAITTDSGVEEERGIKL